MTFQKAKLIVNCQHIPSWAGNCREPQGVWGSGQGGHRERSPKPPAGVSLERLCVMRWHWSHVSCFLKLTRRLQQLQPSPPLTAVLKGKRKFPLLCVCGVCVCVCVCKSKTLSSCHISLLERSHLCLPPQVCLPCHYFSSLVPAECTAVWINETELTGLLMKACSHGLHFWRSLCTQEPLASLSLPLPPSSSLAQPFPKPLHGGLLGALSSTPAGTSAQLATLNKPNSFSRPCSSAPSLPSTITLGNSKKRVLHDLAPLGFLFLQKKKMTLPPGLTIFLQPCGWLGTPLLFERGLSLSIFSLCFLSGSLLNNMEDVFLNKEKCEDQRDAIESSVVNLNRNEEQKE
ncbi:hypothetical protein QTO34_008483 [Cnephaeus nilssonii]|uniref:Uncharacterized protein n=1 Tax=Cnephaeus nilssonii TaxID=3371016 RepID=A0AA40IAD2_CNENI|nr:hypothetical protein QTO34_008483 [Eptesicus nilssonii]